MYARFSRYRFRVEDLERYDAASSALRATDTSETVSMLVGMEGCHGAWELQADTADGPGIALFTLWATREQAESVAERAREWIAQHFQDIGINLTAPPEAEVYPVMAWRGLHDGPERI